MHSTQEKSLILMGLEFQVLVDNILVFPYDYES